MLYGLANVHKPVADRCPSPRPILSAINIPSYKLAKFLVSLLTPLTSKDYTVKDLLSFAQEVSSFDCAHYLTSFNSFRSLLELAAPDSFYIFDGKY